MSVGCWMYKFTEDGKGPMHKRFFTVLIDKQKVLYTYPIVTGKGLPHAFNLLSLMTHTFRLEKDIDLKFGQL